MQSGHTDRLEKQNQEAQQIAQRIVRLNIRGEVQGHRLTKETPKSIAGMSVSAMSKLSSVLFRSTGERCTMTRNIAACPLVYGESPLGAVQNTANHPKLQYSSCKTRQSL